METAEAAFNAPEDPFTRKVQDWAKDTLPAHMYDRNAPAIALQRESGVPVHDLLQVVPGANAMGDDIIRRVYVPILKPVADHTKQLEIYMGLRRSQELIRRGKRVPENMNYVETTKALDQLKQKVGPEVYAQIERAADDLWKANTTEVLDELRAAGMIDTNQYLALKTNNEYYIPFHREGFDTGSQGRFTRAAEGNVSSTGIKKLSETGSTRPVKNALAEFLGEVPRVQSVIARNKASKSIVQALETMQRRTGEELVRYVEPKREMNLVERVTGEKKTIMSKAEHSLAECRPPALAQWGASTMSPGQAIAGPRRPHR